MKNDIGLAWMVVVFGDRIHGVVSVGAQLVNTGDGAVADCTAVMPGYGSALGNGLERGCFFDRHGGVLLM
ncbi:hypothetical protein [Candidatus Aalborgicola defluviihabitans]|uniref:hypothetical protein n=1 Tax=Candidatus Aalborgicola defluviihabitans TaxID=3386187 RepID=UPI001DCEC654|nr:hypothetical protein [Burkholderiales bacterium]